MKTAVALVALAFLIPPLAFAGNPFFASPGPATSPSGQSPALIDPAAAKTLDNNDLVNNLTGTSDAGALQSSRLHEITARMKQSAARLSAKDAGLTTQEIQSRIVASLDALIQQLKQSENQSPKSKPSSSSPRAMRSVQNLSANGAAGATGTSPATTSDPKFGAAAAPSLSQELSELRTQFMTLPYKDRNAILNMKAQDCLPEYREMVARYYKALAEIAKSRQNP